MDQDDLKSILISRNIDIWHLIGTAIDVAASDHGSELRTRRDGIVQKMYARKIQTSEKSRPIMEHKSIFSSDSERREKFLLDIKESLKDLNQTAESLSQLLRKLESVDMTLKSLKETGIGRHVNVLRKHSSNEVQKIAKQLIKNWEAIVHASGKNNSENDNLVPVTAVKESSQMIQVKNDIQGLISSHLSTVTNPYALSTSVKKNEHNSNLSEEERFENARKRLQENYQGAENVKRRRSIKILDVPEKKGSLIVHIKCRPKPNDEVNRS